MHVEIAEGVTVLACVYCLSRPLCSGGLKFKVCMCVCVCVGRLIIFCTAKDDLSLTKLNSQSGGGRGGEEEEEEEEIEFSQAANEKKTEHPFFFLVEVTR